jgi:hypothetical protein
MNNEDITYTWRIQGNDTYTMFTRNGKKHNVMGPALIIGLDEYYYVNGKEFSYTQWTDYTSGLKAYEPSYYTREWKAWDEAEIAANKTYVDGDSPAEHP